MKKPRLRLALLTPVALAILLLAAYAMFQQGGWFPAIVFAALAVLTFAFAALMLAPATRRLGQVSGGVGLTNSPGIALIVVGFLVFGLMMPVSLIVLWVTSGTRPIAASGPLVMFGIAVVAAAPVVVRLLRGGYRLGGLEITPETVTYTSFVREHSIGWDSVVEIEMHPTLGRLELYATQLPTVRGPRVLAGEMPSDARTVPDPHVLVIPPGLLRTDGAQLRALLEYYRTHPRKRHELGDGSALERTFDRVSS